MKTIALFCCLIGSPALVLAADTPQPGTPSQLCYSYSSLAPSGILRLLKPALAASLTERKVPKKLWPRSFQCVLGAIPALQRAVVDVCRVGQDPTITVTNAFTVGVEPCFNEVANKPVFVFPPVAADPNAPVDDSAQ